MSDNLQQILADEIELLLLPLVVANESGIERQLLADLTGWDLKSGPTLSDQLASFLQAFNKLGALIQNPPETLDDVLDALGEVSQIAAAIRQIPTQPSTAVNGVEQLGQDLVHALVIEYLKTWHPLVYDVLVLLTVIRPPADISLQRITDLFQDGLTILREEYLSAGGLVSAADAEALSQKLFPRLASLFEHSGFSAVYGNTPANGVDVGEAGSHIAGGLITVYLQPDFETGNRYGFVLGLSPTDLGNFGLIVVPFGDISPYWDVDVDLTAAPTGFAIGPNGFTVFGASDPSGLNATSTLITLPGVVLGGTTGTRLELGQFLVSGEFNLGLSDHDYGLVLDLGSSALIVSGADGDGFLQSILPAGGARADFDLGLAWSHKQGLKLRGAGGLDATLPVSISAGGVVSVDSIHVGLQADDAGIRVECSATAGLSLGPVHVIVDRMGLLLDLTFPDQGANLGILNAGLDFKPPSGLGVAVDSGVVTGGGFLTFDPTKSEYSGAASLSIEGIGVSAFGLVQTQPEVSFLLLIATTFPTPIQLGMGFSLAGVGGLAGINRMMALDAVETAIWKGTAKDILFPSSPIANASAIVGELDALFPAAGGRYVFGPTAEIYWGTPPLITAQIGVIIELPSPVRIALIGSAIAQFPPEKPLIVLQVTFAGGIDFGACRYFFDASLTGSRIESYPLTGDLSLRSVWAEPKNFALSVGGFNSHFQPPAGFPSLKRIALDVSDGPLHLHLSAYLAITSNTFQIGADVHVTASICDVDVDGYFGFEALFIKNPFSFTIEINGSVSLSVEGETFASVHIGGTLSGPAPWHAVGSASVSLLFFSIGASFDRSWGSKPPDTLPGVDPWTAALQPAIANPANWHGQVPTGVHPVVTFAPATGGEILLDPAGDLVLSQKSVPLNQPIERFAETKLPEPVRFGVASPSVNGTSVAATDWTLVTNEFAPAQFSEMSDDQKLSSESFVALPSGIAIDVGANTGNSTPAALTYDLIILDSSRNPGRPVRFLPPRAMQIASASSGPSARAPWRSAGLGAFSPASDAVPKAALSGRTFSLVSTEDLSAQPGAGAVAATRYQAALALADFTRQNAVDPSSVQAVPQWEAA